MVPPPHNPNLYIMESVWDYGKGQKQLRHQICIRTVVTSTKLLNNCVKV